MLNSRLITTLRELMAADSVVTSDYLANVSRVSPRTIREDIKELEQTLEDHGASIMSIRGKGYRLNVNDNESFRKYLQKVLEEDTGKLNTIPDSPESRVVFLMRRFLIAEGYLKTDDLAEEILVSKSTIQNDLKEVKLILDNYGLSLQGKPNYGLKVTGDEVKLRFCLAEYLFDRSKEAATNMLSDQLADLIEEDIFSDIWDIITERIRRNGLTLSDIAINNLFVHLVIAYKRVKSGYYVSMHKKDMWESANKKEHDVACQIVRDIEKKLDMAFPEVEIAYITLHLLGTKMITENHKKVHDLEPIMDDSYVKLTKQLLKEIETKMTLGIEDDEELIMAISIHLKPAINRYRFGMNIRNPLLQDIKQTYPLAFEAGVIAGLALEKLTEVAIDENEIGYLALHIGAAVERRNLRTEKPKRAIIVCASGVGSAQMLKYKLKSRFSTKIDIIRTTEYYKLKQEPLEDIDIIISSIPINDELPVPVVHVNTILTDSDFLAIENSLEGETSTVLEYIYSDLIFINKKADTKEEILEFLALQLEERGTVDESFLEGVYEREKVAPTAYGNLVAIPHPVTPKWNETFVAICTLEKPVIWGQNPVQLVCLLNVKKGSTEDLEALYGLLTKIVESPALVQQCLKSVRKEELMRCLLNTEASL